MSFTIGLGLGAEAVMALAALLAPLPDGTDPAADCTVEKKRDAGSSDCKRNGFCGGSECCYTEFVIPPHDELVPGNRRIESAIAVPGSIIYRKCDPPYSFLGLTFGRFTCEIEAQIHLDGYFLYTLASCPDVAKKNGTSTTGS